MMIMIITIIIIIKINKTKRIFVDSMLLSINS